uniref:Ovule protein n=1 Tax=Rhabditophanes sp. KR3021 TaxID=114890 RepID=A0AC35UH23_9BILA
MSKRTGSSQSTLSSCIKKTKLEVIDISSEKVDENKMEPSVLEHAKEESIVGPVSNLDLDEDEKGEVHDRLEDFMKPDEAYLVERQ